MSKSLFRVAVLGAPLLLAACGEGYEVQKTDAHFPYGNKRTAGSGVAYVVAQMMQERELNVEPVATPPAPVTPVLDAEEIFDDAQGKKSRAYHRASTPHASPQSTAMAPSAHREIEKNEASVGVVENATPVAHADAVNDMQKVEEVAPNLEVPDAPEVILTHAPQPAEVVEEVLANDLPQPVVEHMSAEEYVSRAPTHVSTPEIQVIDAAPAPPSAAPMMLEDEIEIPQELIENDEHGANTEHVENLEPAAGEDVFGDIREEVIELYREDVGGSQSSIVAPKRDLYLPFLRNKSREELDDIYQQF